MLMHRHDTSVNSFVLRANKVIVIHRRHINVTDRYIIKRVNNINLDPPNGLL